MAQNPFQINITHPEAKQLYGLFGISAERAEQLSSLIEAEKLDVKENESIASLMSKVSAHCSSAPELALAAYALGWTVKATLK